MDETTTETATIEELLAELDAARGEDPALGAALDEVEETSSRVAADQQAFTRAFSKLDTWFKDRAVHTGPGGGKTSAAIATYNARAKAIEAWAEAMVRRHIADVEVANMTLMDSLPAPAYADLLAAEGLEAASEKDLAAVMRHVGPRDGD